MQHRLAYRLISFVILCSLIFQVPAPAFSRSQPTKPANSSAGQVTDSLDTLLKPLQASQALAASAGQGNTDALTGAFGADLPSTTPRTFAPGGGIPTTPRRQQNTTDPLVRLSQRVEQSNANQFSQANVLDRLNALPQDEQHSTPQSAPSAPPASLDQSTQVDSRPDSTAQGLTPARSRFTLYLPFVSSGTTNVSIGPNTGGVLRAPDGVTITFAPGAVKAQAWGTYRAATPHQMPDGLVPVGRGFDLAVARAADAAPVALFVTQVTTSTVYDHEFRSWHATYTVTPTVQVKIAYSGAAIAGLQEQSLRLYRQDPQTGAWKAMPTLVDAHQRFVWATIERAGRYALFGTPALLPSARAPGFTQALSTSQTLVIVDPDHGGDDPGGQVYTPAQFRTEEKTHNLEVALLLRDLLLACGVQVDMTRDSDVSVTTSQRAGLINVRQPNVAVTVAFNVAGLGTMLNFDGGAMQLVNYGQPASVAFGRAINGAIANDIGLSTHRGVQNVNTWSFCGGNCVGNLVTNTPHSQSESAFLDSYADREFIDAHSEAFAGAIFSAIVDQLGGRSTCGSGFQFPEPLSAAERARLRNLGWQNWLHYGGDPVSFSTGNHIQQFSDLHIPGIAGFDLLLQRTYNSLDRRDGAFAVGWSSPLDMNLRLARDGSVDLRKADGSGVYFVASGDGYTPGQQGVFDVLSRNGPDFLLYDQHAQRFYQFKVTGAYGWLTSVSDRHGNTITLERDSSNHVSRIVDTAGRAYTLSYSGDHIAAIADPLGRTISYSYDGNNDLVSVTDANGGVRRFEYSDHHLNKLIDPAGILYLQNSYDGEGRVVEQIDASGVHSSFSYGTSDTTFTDNLGNKTITRYDDRSRVTEIEDALGQKQRFAYDDAYNVVTYTDKRGNAWNSTYDERGNLLTTTDPLHHTVSYSYNATNDLTSMTDQGGLNASARTTRFVYDDAGDLLQINRPDTTTINSTYDAKGQRLTLADTNGGTTTYGYDGQGNVITVADPLTSQTHYAYDAVGRTTRITDANGHTAQFVYDNNDNITRLVDPKGHAATLTYDRNDDLTRMVDRRGGVTTYAYDENLKLVGETDPEGHTTAYAYDAMYNRISAVDARQNVTRYTYDAIYRLTAVEDALHGVTGFAYDANGNVTRLTDALNRPTAFEYDPLDRLVKQTDALNGVTSWTYDAVGRRTATTNARGATTSYSYDLLDRLTLVRDALNGAWTYTYDANGNLTTATDANGHTTALSYDAANRMFRRVDAGGHATQLAYDGVGNTTTVADALGRLTRYTYDANDNLARITDALSGTTTLVYDAEDTPVAVTDANGHTTRFAYDRDGLLVTLTEAGGQVSRMAYDPTHNLVRFTNAKGNAWDYTYDALNRRTSETDPLHHATHYDYDAVGNSIRTTDANSIATRSDFDPLDRLIAVVQNDRPGAVSDQQTNVTTRYTYDPVGNLIATIDANGETTHLSYDLLDRLTSEVNPLGHTWRYGYDAVGNPTARTDAKGQLTRYRYDADDLLTAISYPDSSSISFGYDAIHNQTTMTDQLGQTRNEYDALNRLVASTNHAGQRVGYRYDPVGNRTAMTYPDGRTLRYDYDPTNFAVRVVDPDGNAFNVTRDPTHNIVKVDNPNATTAEYDIDAAERLTAVRNLTSQNPHEVIGNFTYTLDAVGNRTRTEETYRWRKPAQLTNSYTYDPLYRLTRSDDSESHFTTYDYDAVGNRTREVTNDDPTLVRKIDTTTTEYTYDAANELVTSLRADEPRGNADRTAQTAQALRAFTHEVEAQDGHHIDAATAQALLDQANALIGALDGSSPPSVDETATALAALESAVQTARSQGQIDNDGTANSLLAKLRHADDANAARGPELFATLYDYDLNGNRIRRTAANDGTGTTRDWLKTEYEYDFENRLTHVQDFHNPGSGNWLSLDETFLKYDGYGRVFRRQHDQHIGGGGAQQWTDYVYDGLDPIAEYDNPSSQYTNYYRGLGHILSQHDFKSQQSPAGTLSYYHYDGLDSVVGMTKQLGQSVHNYRYNDYGIILDTNGHAADASNFSDPHNHYTYTGQEWDEQTGLFHFYAREYDPAAGVWLQQDPYRGQLSDPKTLHRYGYVMNRPTLLVDRYGYCPWCIGALVGAVAGAAIAYGAQVVNNISQNGFSADAFTQNIDGGKILAGAVVGAVGGATFGLGLLAGGALGTALEVSGIAASALGVATVAVSGAVAGQAQRATDNVLNGRPITEGLGNPRDIAVDAALSVTFFKAFGGSFRNVARPSTVNSAPVSPRCEKAARSTSITEGAARSNLRSAVGGVVGDGMQAHHIIPWNLRNNPLIQRLVQQGLFDFNGADNGILLGPNEHLGSHPQYDAFVQTELNALQSRASAGGWSEDQLLRELQRWLAQMQRDIQSGTITPNH